MTRQPGPIPGSYWVEPGRLCAGEYPSSSNPGATAEKLRRIRDAGIDSFVDLTEEGEYGLAPYAEQLEGLEYVRLSIPDFTVPSPERMREILDTIAEALDRGRTVYVHCYGGIGRTGTVVACHLIGRGATAREALDSIADWRRETPDAYRKSPETDEQRRFVERWRP